MGKLIDVHRDVCLALQILDRENQILYHFVRTWSMGMQVEYKQDLRKKSCPYLRWLLAGFGNQQWLSSLLFGGILVPRHHFICMSCNIFALILSQGFCSFYIVFPAEEIPIMVWEMAQKSKDGFECEIL